MIANNKAKIIGILIISIILSQFGLINIFFCESPKIRKDLAFYVSQKLNKLIKDGNFLVLFKKETYNETPEIRQTISYLKNNLNYLTKGVKGATKNNVSYTEYYDNQIEWVVMNYTLSSGKIIKIKFPKGMEPPPKEIFDE